MAPTASILGASPVGAQDDPQTRSTMGAILGSLTVVLPLSLSDARYSDPAQREAVRAALQALAADGARLEAHGASQDASFGFLSRSLARDTREILERYEEERFAESRFLLHQVTDNCVACHSRLPDPNKHPVGARLFENSDMAALPPVERVELEVATRQFEQALDTYEDLFADPSTSPADLDLLGTLDGYLELCLRVAGDPERPAATFEKLARRDDVSPPLRRTLQAWATALRELAADEAREASLANARELIDAARSEARFEGDRRNLVRYVAASALLHRRLAAGGLSAIELAQAYYWLGVIESHVGRSFWLSQTEHFLEASIRAAPQSPVAEEAYALLEEFVVSGYTGSAGTGVPEDERERLASLRRLLDANAPKPSGTGAASAEAQ